MTKESVLKILNELNTKQTETITLEVKSAKKGKPEKIFDTISSFANTIGGIILFGIEEIKKKNTTSFEIVGVYDANDLQKNITNLCSDEFEPIIRPEIDIININDKTVVAVKIDSLSMKNKPCYYKPKGIHNGSFIRIGDRDDHMSEYEIYKFLSYKDHIDDDLRPVISATYEDLDKQLLEEFIEKYTINDTQKNY